MTYSIKNHPGGYDIYKDGKPLDANEVVRLLEQGEQFEHGLKERGKTWSGLPPHTKISYQSQAQYERAMNAQKGHEDTQSRHN